MSKFKRTDKKRPILVNKQTKIFDLFPGGVYGSGLKVKDFKGVMKSRKKNKMGGVIKASEGVSVSPKMTDYTKDLIGKADKGLGKAITQGKNLLGAIGAKVKRAGEIMKKGPSAAITKTGPVKDFAIAKQAAKASFKPSTKTLSAGKSKALVTSRTAKLFKAARFARAVTPIGAASIVIGAGVKKRDPKAVKRERDFFKGKKYKDVGFESMMDYAKPKNKGGVISYNKGGFNYAINRKR
jgi:hypothetical protein